MPRGDVHLMLRFQVMGTTMCGLLPLAEYITEDNWLVSCKRCIRAARLDVKARDPYSGRWMTRQAFVDKYWDLIEEDRRTEFAPEEQVMAIARKVAKRNKELLTRLDGV